MTATANIQHLELWKTVSLVIYLIFAEVVVVKAEKVVGEVEEEKAINKMQREKIGNALR